MFASALDTPDVQVLLSSLGALAAAAAGVWVAHARRRRGRLERGREKVGAPSSPPTHLEELDVTDPEPDELEPLDFAPTRHRFANALIVDGTGRRLKRLPVAKHVQLNISIGPRDPQTQVVDDVAFLDHLLPAGDLALDGVLSSADLLVGAEPSRLGRKAATSRLILPANGDPALTPKGEKDPPLLSPGAAPDEGPSPDYLLLPRRGRTSPTRRAARCA